MLAQDLVCNPVLITLDHLLKPNKKGKSFELTHEMQSACSLLDSPHFHSVLQPVSSVPSAVVQIPDAASAGFEQHLHGPAFKKENLIKSFLGHMFLL